MMLEVWCGYVKYGVVSVPVQTSHVGDGKLDGNFQVPYGFS